ncbi:GNAT family N-acetyltransferase [Streptomyces sp. BYX5S]
MPTDVPPVIPPGTLSGTPQPTLHSTDGELTLRTPRFTDAPAIHTAFQDPTLRHWHLRGMADEAEARAWIASTHDGWREETAATWFVTRTTDGAPLGRMALRALDLEEGVAEVGYWVLPAARGLGVAPRALTAMTHWALATGFHRIDLQHSTRNAPSCRVALKSGYPLEGTRRSSALHADGWHDMHVHARINS